MNFCACPDSAPVSGICLLCGRLNERDSLLFLTANGGANLTLHTNSQPNTEDVSDWLRDVKDRMVSMMLARLAEIAREPPIVEAAVVKMLAAAAKRT